MLIIIIIIIIIIFESRIQAIHVQILVPKYEKTKKSEKFSGLQNGTIRVLQIGTGFKDYKSGQEGLQIGAALGISNQVRHFKLRQRNFKSGQEGFQIEAGITSRGKDVSKMKRAFNIK